MSRNSRDLVGIHDFYWKLRLKATETAVLTDITPRFLANEWSVSAKCVPIEGSKPARNHQPSKLPEEHARE